jgi:hypothetical protein
LIANSQVVDIKRENRRIFDPAMTMPHQKSADSFGGFVLLVSAPRCGDDSDNHDCENSQPDE